MIQKITLEIQNDTGLEFEEAIELRPLRHGDYWFNGHDKIVGPIDGDYGARRHVLTPKVDAELESAKKKFPVGSWVMCPSRDTHAVYKVSKVDRNSYLPDIILVHGGVYTCEVSLCTPFPLPTWRCCETDKPEKSCSVITRHKLEHSFKKLGMDYVADKGWESIYSGREKDYEWLDEGEL